jgi:hypothetical protein
MSIIATALPPGTLLQQFKAALLEQFNSDFTLNSIFGYITVNN